MKPFFRRVWPYGVPIAFYALVVVLVFGRALIPGATEMIWGDDIHRSYYFYRQFFNNFLSQGIWPWWNPYNFAGSPFMANPIVNMVYPGSWLFVLLPLNIAYSWHIALHLLWAMMGMYTLLGRISNISREAGSRFAGQYPISNDKKSFIIHHSSFIISLSAWLSGLIFGLSGFFTARIWAGHVDVIAAASWIPWVVTAFAAISNISREAGSRFAGQFPISNNETEIQKYRQRRAVVIAGAVLAMQMFAGYQTIAMLTLEAVGIMTVITLVAQRATMRMMFMVMTRIALSILLAIGLFAVVLVPQQEFFRQTIRTYALPYSWNAYGSLTWKSLGQFFNPFFFGDQLTYAGPPPNFSEHAFFVGRTGLFIIALVGIIWAIRLFLSSPRRRGSSLPIKMDSGSWAGMTLTTWVWYLTFFAIAAFGLWVSLGPNAPIDLQYILWKFIPMYHFLRIPPRHLILVAFGLSSIIGFAMSALRRKRLSLLIAGLITIEMILYARHFIVLRPIPETRHDTALIKILKQDNGPYRVLTNFGAWAPPRDSFDFDAGMNYGVFNATGYDTMILRPYYEFIDASNGKTSPSILEHDVQIPYLNVFSKATDLLNIKYILHPRGYDPLLGSKDPRFRLIREDVVRDYRLYENTTVLPRFYFADNKEGRVEIEKYSPNEIKLTTDNAVGDTLVSSEVYYPGWEGFVDGQKVDVIRVNNAFRALFVPAGRHTVVYRYNPRIFVFGGLVSMITVGFCAIVMLKKI